MKKLLQYSFFFSLLIANFLLSCNNGNPGKENITDKATKTAEGKTSYRKPGTENSDTLTITPPSAVFFMPDSVQLGKIKSALDTLHYENDTHDCFYQMRNARNVLKEYWPQIRIVETSEARYLYFVDQSKPGVLVDLNSRNDMCGIYLFSKEKDPLFIDMMNIDTQLSLYFSK